MSIANQQQLAVSRNKLQLLEDQLVQLDNEPVRNPVSRAWTRRSLKKLVNRLKEEIAVFTSRQATPAE